MEILAITATIAGILGFFYLLIIGQKSVPEWWRERKSNEDSNTSANNQIATETLPDNAKPILHNLPHRIDFVGREKEKQQVHEALNSRSYITMIDGIGGIGKTSLALEVLHECLAASQNSSSNNRDLQKFESFIWTSARDHELEINDVLDTIAHTLEYTFITQLPLEEKRHKIVKLLQDKQCLVIVDNFETITDEAVREFILKLPDPSKCLVTSRTLGLQQARSVSIRGLKETEALLLIKNEGIRLGLDLDLLISDENNFRRFYAATGGAPLAIRWSIGQIKQRGQSIESVLNSLHGARGDMFEFIFERAWSLLSDEAKKILTIMPVFASSASKAAIEAASDVHTWELDEGLGQLVELWLLEASASLGESQRRYGLHPLTQAFAQNRLSKDSDLEYQTRIRLADFFEELAKDAGGDRWAWTRYDEIEEEKDNIFNLIEWSFKNNESVLGISLTKSIIYFASYRGYHEASFFGKRAIKLARQLGRMDDLASLLIHIGWIETNKRNLDDGEFFISEGFSIYESLKYAPGKIYALRSLSRTLRYKGEFDKARKLNKESIALAKLLKDEFEILCCEKEIALLAISEGKYGEAKKRLESIISRDHKKDEAFLASTLVYLASVNYRLGDYDAAISIGIESLELAKKVKRRPIIAWALQTLATIEAERGNYQTALTFGEQALEIFGKSVIFDPRVEKLKTLVKKLKEKAN